MRGLQDLGVRTNPVCLCRMHGRTDGRLCDYDKWACVPGLEAVWDVVGLAGLICMRMLGSETDMPGPLLGGM